MAVPEIPFDTLAGAAQALRSGVLSARELTDAVLARVDTVNPRIGALTDVLVETARKEAAAVDQRRSEHKSLGPLAGVPFVIKDLIDTAPAVCAAGLSFLEDYRPAKDAAVVRRLRRAGAVILGVAATDSGAFDVRTPAVTHPQAPGLTVGGSSGGSGAAVAAGLGFAALGTDTGGSIRIPAACCQIAGLMPSPGRVPMDGIRPLAWSLDHVGPLARRVSDIALVQPVLDPAFARTAKRKRKGALTVGHDPNFYADAGDVSRAAMVSAIAACREFGAEFREIALPCPDDVFDMHITIFRGEAAAYHLAAFGDRLGEYPPLPRRLLEKGEELPAHEYVRAGRLRAAVTKQVADQFKDVDFILAPTLPVTAPERDAESVEVGGRGMAVLNALIRYTFLFDHVGTPVVSLPVITHGPGVGASVQIIARANADAAAVDFARRLEEVLSLTVDYELGV